MSPDTRRLGVVPDVERSTVRRVTGVAVALAGLLLLLGLAALLPGVDRLVAGLSVPPAALLAALVTVLVAGALVVVAPAVRTAVRQSLGGPDALVADAAASAKLLVDFAAVVVAYRGLAGAVVPLFDAFGLEGVYHLAFLAVGLVVLGAFARRLYRCWDPVADLLTDRVAGDVTDGNVAG